MESDGEAVGKGCVLHCGWGRVASKRGCYRDSILLNRDWDHSSVEHCQQHQTYHNARTLYRANSRARNANNQHMLSPQHRTVAAASHCRCSIAHYLMAALPISRRTSPLPRRGLLHIIIRDTRYIFRTSKGATDYYQRGWRHLSGNFVRGTLHLLLTYFFLLQSM